MASLTPMLNPSSVVFVGASEESDWFSRMYRNMLEYNGNREIFFANPNRKQVFGKHCFDSVTDIEADIDLAIVLVPAPVVPSVIDECGETEVRTALVVGSNFAEAGEKGKELQNQLGHLSEKHGLPICGPNSFGIISTYDRFIASTIRRTDFTEGKVSLVSQSGGLFLQYLYTGIERGIGFSTVVDSGNQAVLSASDFLEYLLEDDRTDLIVVIAEAFTNPKKFLRLTERANEIGKPIIVLKLAKSDEGRQAAISHTGSIATTRDIVSTALKQYGVVEVSSIEELIETTELFAKSKIVTGDWAGAVDISGGGTTLFADLISESDLSLAKLSPSTVEKLEDYIPEIGTVNNPTDLAVPWGADPVDQKFAEILEIYDDDSDLNMLACRLTIPLDDMETEKSRLKEIAEVNEDSDTLYVIVSRTNTAVPDEWVNSVQSTNIPLLFGYENSIQALEHLAKYSSFMRERKEKVTEIIQEDVEKFSATFDEKIVHEYTAKQILSERSFNIPDERLVSTPEEAVEAAKDIGFPVCLKVISPEIPHKTDMGALAINISSEEEVRSNYSEIMDAVLEANPDADISGVLVQEMILDGKEILIGSKNTPFGQAIVVGIGGIFAEIYEDTTMRIAPISEKEAKGMLQELRGYDALVGARNQTAVDVERLAECVSKFSKFIAVNDGLSEADLNPVLITENDYYIVDALFKVPEKI